jgi:hypothetical protein
VVGVVLDEAVDHGLVVDAGAEGGVAVGDRAAHPLHVFLRAAGQRLQELVERGLQELLIPVPGALGDLVRLGPVPLLGKAGRLAAEAAADLVLPGDHVEHDLPDAVRSRDGMRRRFQGRQLPEERGGRGAVPGIVGMPLAELLAKKGSLAHAGTLPGMEGIIRLQAAGRYNPGPWS